ncbi:hypothetical protein [Streptomyces chartreusis]
MYRVGGEGGEPRSVEGEVAWSVSQLPLACSQVPGRARRAPVSQTSGVFPVGQTATSRSSGPGTTLP